MPTANTPSLERGGKKERNNKTTVTHQDALRQTTTTLFLLRLPQASGFKESNREREEGWAHLTE